MKKLPFGMSIRKIRENNDYLRSKR